MERLGGRMVKTIHDDSRKFYVAQKSGKMYDISLPPLRGLPYVPTCKVMCCPSAISTYLFDGEALFPELPGTGPSPRMPSVVTHGRVLPEFPEGSMKGMWGRQNRMVLPPRSPLCPLHCNPHGPDLGPRSNVSCDLPCARGAFGWLERNGPLGGILEVSVGESSCLACPEGHRQGQGCKGQDKYLFLGGDVPSELVKAGRIRPKSRTPLVRASPCCLYEEARLCGRGRRGKLEVPGEVCPPEDCFDGGLGRRPRDCSRAGLKDKSIPGEGTAPRP